jgi:Kef-type K+ transport system membrane component KefB
LFPEPGSVWYITLLINLGILIALIIGIIFVVPFILKFIEKRFKIFSDSRTNYFTLGIIFGLLALLVYFAESLGISGAIIAFLFGFSIQNNKVLIGDVKEAFIKMGEGLFLPLFFFAVGANFLLDFTAFSPLLLLVVPIAILSKGLGTFAGSSIMKFKPKESLKITVGMIPRAEIILVIAEIGLIQGIFSQSVFSMAILLVFISVIITPIGLKLLFREPKSSLPKSEYNRDELDNIENGYTEIVEAN